MVRRGDRISRPPRSVRASPAVMTEPVTSTPPPPSPMPSPRPSSARVTARSIASSSRRSTTTRSGPKIPAAMSPSVSADSSRVEFCADDRLQDGLEGIEQSLDVLVRHHSDDADQRREGKRLLHGSRRCLRTVRVVRSIQHDRR